MMLRHSVYLTLVLAVACGAPTSPLPPATLPPTPATSPSPSSSGPARPPSTEAPTTEAPPTEAPLAIAPAGGATATAEPTPPAPSPTSTALETLSRPEETGALAAAPPSGEAAASAGRPAAVLPPSARLVPRLTPTPNVVASSPALAAPGPAVGGGADYWRAIKLVQDSRKSPAAPRLEERINSAIARARVSGGEIEVLGWQAGLKGTTDLYQVSFMVRENRQGLRAEWEANLATGEVRPANPLAEALDAP